MLSVGLDLHKRYSHLEVIDESGQRRAGGRVGNEFEEIEGFFRSLGEPCRVVLEAGWNWGLMHDWLERVESVVEVQLAHPYGVRAIASAQVKTDRIDARMLGQLLRVGLIPRAHIPSSQTRQLREAVRQRLFLVRLRTMLKNRIHALLDRHHIIGPPASDLFGKRGRDFLLKVEMPGLAQPLLRQDLRLLERLWGRRSKRPRSFCSMRSKAIAGSSSCGRSPDWEFSWRRLWQPKSIGSIASADPPSWWPTPVWFPRPTPQAVRPLTGA